MNIIIDLILVAILVVSAVFAAKKGLIGTIFSLASTVVAIALSLMLCAPVSGFIDNTFVNKPVKQYILSAVDSTSIGKSYDQAIENIDVAGKIEAMPQSLKSVLELANVDVDEMVAKAKAVQNDTASAKDELINKIAAPISATISKVIALVVLFAVLSIGLWVVAKLITAVFNALPLGKSLNKFGGLAFGILRGLIIVFVIATLFSAITKMVDPKSNNIFSQKTVDSTVVLKTTMDFNPVNAILKIK